jgi:hypothetical protein
MEETQAFVMRTQTFVIMTTPAVAEEGKAADRMAAGMLQELASIIQKTGGIL